MTGKVRSIKDWEESRSPQRMIEFFYLIRASWPKVRKLQLWAIACIRLNGGHGLNSSGDFLRKTLNTLEELAELPLEESEPRRRALLTKTKDWKSSCNREYPLSSSVEDLLSVEGKRLPRQVCYAAGCHGRYLPIHDPLKEEKDTVNADLLRCVLGNICRLTPLEDFWRTPTVTALAQAAYDSRMMPLGTLETARLAVLSDALEEAGCDKTFALNHLREPGAMHVRGCWVVDLILRKV